MHYLMPVVQLYISSSVEACPLWKCCFHKVSLLFSSSYYYLLLSLLPWQWFSFTITLYHKILELFYLWCQSNLKLQENCAINAQAANHLKTAVIVTFLARSLALHRTAEPQEALWHFPNISCFNLTQNLADQWLRINRSQPVKQQPIKIRTSYQI